MQSPKESPHVFLGRTQGKIFDPLPEMYSVKPGRSMAAWISVNIGFHLHRILVIVLTLVAV